MSLTKQERDALPSDQFAVPSKRRLPMPDQRHVSLAWSQLARTTGLTGGERVEARKRILRRASDLGMNASKWEATCIDAMSLTAMAVELPDVTDHPNRMPFSGVLVHLDQPSDAPPGGSKGKLVMMSKAAAERALPSLMGMAVNYTPDFDGHDVQRKLGVITGAEIDGSDLRIEGFIYAADFPEEAADIKTNKDALGFSFEAQQILVESLETDPLVITDCVFTGAAILMKDKAAFTTTSLAAAAATTGELDMTDEELKAILAAALKPMTDEIAALKAGQTELGEKIEAGKELHAKVAPHAEKLRSIAAGLQAAGIGTHATRGQAAILNRMADNMEAEAMSGSTPHIFRETEYPSYYAAAEPGASKADPADTRVAALEATIASMKTEFGDKIAAARAEVKEPERKTLSPAIASLMAKAGVAAPEGDKKLSVGEVDRMLASQNMSIVQRIQFKTELSRAGMLDEAA